MFDWLLSRKRSRTICERLGYHSFEWNYTWGFYCCRWCGLTVKKPTDDLLVTCATCGVEVAAERAFPCGDTWLCIDHADDAAQERENT